MPDSSQDGMVRCERHSKSPTRCAKSSAAVVARLRRRGIEVAMITGDGTQDRQEAIATTVGIDRVIADGFPGRRRPR